MKKLFLILCLLVMGGVVMAQEAAKPSGPMFSWEKSTHDFGDITQGQKVEFVYKFTNTGTEPLIISNVNVTCGCTVPKGWPRDPIPPGGKGEIPISFNSAGKSGKQNKVITIISNAVNEKKTVSFTANIVDKTVP